MLVRILELGGYGRVVSTVESGEVMRICAEEKPDLVLLDLTMPPPTGFDLLTELRGGAIEPIPAIVVISGHEHPAIERQALELGASAMLAKTTPRAEILERLDDILLGGTELG